MMLIINIDWGLVNPLEDDRFKTNASRVSNREYVTKVLNEVTKRKTSNQWLGELEKAKIGCGPINNLSDVFNDPHVISREMIMEMQHSKTGKKPLKLISNPIKMNQTPVSYRYSPPLLGEHTNEVLKTELNFNEDQIKLLKDKKIV